MTGLRTARTRRELLRSATDDLHRELDAAARRLDLSAHSDYLRFLIANAEPLIALEVALERGGVERLLQDWSLRSRRHAIVADLAAMETAANAPASAPTLTTISEQLGALYVLEGSRLGARALLQTIEQSNDRRVLASLRFLRTSQTTHWTSFLKTLESAEPIDTDAMTASAIAAFDRFRRSFAALAPSPGRM